MSMKSKTALSSAALALVVAACGGGGGGTTSNPAPAPVPPPPPPPPPAETFSVSGSTLADPILDVDSDLADPEAVSVSNDDRASAQEITEDAEIRGFVSCNVLPQDTGPCPAGSDEFDYFDVTLSAGQTLSLTIADRPEQSAQLVDLDLFLLDENGDVVSSSTSATAKVEQVAVTTTQRYFVVVSSFIGPSNYTLSINASPATTAVGPQQVNLANLSTQQVTILDEEALARSGALRDFRADNASADAPVVRSVAISPRELDAPTRGALTRDFPQRVLGLPESETSDASYADKLALLSHVKQVNAAAGADILRPYHYPELLADPAPDPDLQWNLTNISWQQALTNVESQVPGIGRPVIAVLDSGVLSAHPKISPVLTDARDFVPSFIDGDGFDAEAEEDTLPDDPNPDECFVYHGTHVATIASAPRDPAVIDGVDMVGTLPFADLMAIKLGFSQDPQCRFIVGDIAGAIRYAAGLPNSSGTVPARPADVINMSFGGSEPDPATRAAVEEAAAAGVIIVASAGNGGRNFNQTVNYPAAYPDVFSVAATGFDNTRAPYSSFYPQVEIAAPGGNGGQDLNFDGNPDAILGGVGVLNNASDGFDADYALYQGTSMAAPTAAAGFALMKAIYPGLTMDEAREVLEQGLLTDDIEDPGRDVETGFGLMNLEKMVDVAIQLRDGTLALPPDFVIEPSFLDFGNVVEAGNITVSRRNDPTFTITSVTIDADGFPASAVLPSVEIDVDSEGFGEYQVQIDRDEITTSGSYITQVRVTNSDGNDRIIPLTFRIPEVSTVAETGPARIILDRQIGIGRFEQEQTLLVPEGVGGTVTFTDLVRDRYRIRYSTDMDGDGDVCDTGELGGSYPGGDCDSTRSFDLTEDLSDLEFILDRLPE